MAEPGGRSRPDLLEVHERYGAWIRRRLQKCLGPDSEDAVQEVLLRLGPALARLRDTRDEVVRALVSRTVRSVGIDAIRRKARRPTNVSAVDQLVAPGSEAVEDQHELVSMIRDRWRRLPERDRRILKLRLEDGLSFREISELIDVPQGSVAGWYSRAVAQLREGSP